MQGTQFGQYFICEQAMETHFSDVYYAIDKKTGEKNAIKFIKKKRSDESIVREFEINNMINFPYILSISRIIKVKMENYNFAYILPKADGDLFDYFKKKQKLSEDIILPIVKNILKALSYIHGIGIIHRNVKLENILLIDKKGESFKFVLTGFSYAMLYSPGKKYYDFNIESSPYNAPEIYKNIGCFIIK